MAQENSAKPSSEKNKHILKLKITEYILSDLPIICITLLPERKLISYLMNAVFHYNRKIRPASRI